MKSRPESATLQPSARLGFQNIKLRIEAIVTAILLASIVGCATAGVQVLRWDAVSARSQPGSDGARFVRINIDLEHAGQDIWIRMPDGKILSTSELTLEQVWHYVGSGDDSPPASARRGIRFFDLLLPALWRSAGGYSFEFEDGRLVGLGIGVLRPYAPEANRPALASSRSPEPSTLPLTREQLIRLFGPFRDEIHAEGLDTPVDPPSASPSVPGP